MALKTGVKGWYDLGRVGASKAIKSDFAKKKIREIADKYVSKKLDPLHQSGQIDYSKWCPMSMYSPQGVNDPKHPLCKGGSLDIHKAIGKLSKPKSGFILSGQNYLLMVTDVFKYAWIKPLKDKKGETETKAFKTIFTMRVDW